MSVEYWLASQFRAGVARLTSEERRALAAVRSGKPCWQCGAAQARQCGNFRARTGGRPDGQMMPDESVGARWRADKERSGWEYVEDSQPDTAIRLGTFQT